MYVIKVPVIKDSNYPIYLFQEISKHIEDLAFEHQRLPDSLLFIGRIGEDLMKYINDLKWDFSKFRMSQESSSVLNCLVISYQKEFTQVESNAIPTSDESFDGKEIEGIPNATTMSKIVNHSIGGLSYTKERNIKPETRIKLIR